MMGFANIEWLWALALLPALIGLTWWGALRSRKAMERLGDAWLIQRMSASLDKGSRAWKVRLRIAALLFAVLAAARFQYGSHRVDVEHRGIDLIVALDLSTSMLADDITPNRLTKAKFEIGRLVDRLKGDRIGLVAFAGSAIPVCPLTIDYSAFKLFLSGLDTDSIDRQGTDLSAALRVSQRAFGESSQGDRLVLVITDGEDHSGKAAETAEKLADEGIHVYTVGIGETSGRPIPMKTEDGRIVYKKDRQGNIVTTRLDIATLTAMARSGHGDFFHANTAQFSLDEIFADIEKMEQQTFNEELTINRIDRYRWFLIPALFFLGIEPLIRDRRKRDPGWLGRFES